MASNESANEIPPDVAQILKELASFTDPDASYSLAVDKPSNGSFMLSTSSAEERIQGLTTPIVDQGLESRQKKSPGNIQTGVTRNAIFSMPSQDAGSGLNEHLLKLQEITEAARKKMNENEPNESKDSNPTRNVSSPSSIIEWASALRHVSRLATQDPFLETAVQKMIHDQLSNEETWWKQRESLRKAVDQGKAPGLELSRYDAKIYKAQADMYSQMSKELRNLGIPFFEMPSSLIVDGDKAPKGKITSTQLRTLQAKMIDYLQSMYGPDQ